MVLCGGETTMDEILASGTRPNQACADFLGNKHLLSKKELRQWNDAIEEYHRTVEAGKVSCVRS